MNADIYFASDADVDDLIDSIEGNRRYVPCLYILNKIDDISMEELEILDRIPHYVPISGFLEWGLDDLLDTMWNYLDLIRIYTKPKVLFFSRLFLILFREKFRIMKHRLLLRGIKARYLICVISCIERCLQISGMRWFGAPL